MEDTEKNFCGNINRTMGCGVSSMVDLENVWKEALGKDLGEKSIQNWS